ncbi:hypothetical protein G5714_021870 [Onychostoma macrolepis]|uniref:Ig-like domain-containing protein n=1 Tax=Onychostoma macrolepis TaxID=369639 RepID=A0A7J6BW31_9TELE|nr:hypothetical protein G5714_021870 [Onychostoma macrolepis]
MISCCFILVFAVLINNVCLQGIVEGVIGGSVVLLCSSAEHDLKLQDTDVHWRDNNDTIMYSIIKGEHSLVGQDPQYKNRVETFPDECLRGNFSVKLAAVTHADEGKYICYITNPSDSQQKTVQLIIKESKAEKGNKSSDQEENGADSVGKSLLWVSIVVALLVLSIGLIAGFSIFHLRKRNQATSLSSVSTEEQITVP